MAASTADRSGDDAGTERIPIGVFAYDRPENLKLTLESLGRCRGYEDYDLHVFCDAPKTSAATDGVSRARAVAHEWVDAHGGRVVEREKNMRFRNITDGITELCERYGQVVVIEDDVVVSPDFLDYIRSSLEKYEYEDRVFMVTGFMYAIEHPPKPDAFFLPLTCSQGWATWKRAWDRFEWEAPGWRELLKDKKRRKLFNVGGHYSFSKMLKSTMNGELESWAIRFYFAVFKAGGLALWPRRSMVWNTGMGSGVHYSNGPTVDARSALLHGSRSRDAFLTPQLGFSPAFPSRITVDAKAFELVGRGLDHSRGPLYVRVARWILRWLEKLRHR